MKGRCARVTTRIEGATSNPDSATKLQPDHHAFPVQEVLVARIRPEGGLGRKRDRAGHRELQRSIQRFGVLTPITVRRATDESGDFLLIKGQGRTLACRMLGMATIPAVVVDDEFAEAEKVQQFLVENVARLKMRPVDRALLIQRARQEGEETSAIAARFGLSASTVRRLLAQLDGATSNEVEALRAGEVSLAMHAVIARHVEPSERPAVLAIISGLSIKLKELEALFIALGWQELASLGENLGERIVLLDWACRKLAELPSGTLRERFRLLALEFPTALERDDHGYLVVAQ